ncbi:MAG TPA: ROK family protein [Bacteroidales bacterium]|nr:ROK family protein [Bacteroidales bacterium]HPT22097.1 ROK family protein [Bacteroidales bacterium]
MALLGIDLGGTKLELALFSENGDIQYKESVALGDRKGHEVGKCITDQIRKFIQYSESNGDSIISIGISVPGISYISAGTVWAPNIPGWEDYPLLNEVKAVCGDVPVTIDSDRACYILGELWKGNARGCHDAIFLSVGTGIGAGIVINGKILRGSHDIAGCIGWMALRDPFEKKYIECGCFEHYASGEGIAKVAREFLEEQKDYVGELRNKDIDRVTSYDVFAAYINDDPLAASVIRLCVQFWGMAVANLVSLFNPEKIIMGGGVFGPAIPLIPAIKEEAAKWAQPIGITQVTLDVSALAGDAGVYGAGFLALKNIREFGI